MAGSLFAVWRWPADYGGYTSSVQNIDFGFNQIIVRDAKGNKERAVPLPAKLTQSMKDHLSELKKQHSEDLDQGVGRVYMPHTLVLKYGKSDQQWVWQYVFPSYKLSVDPRSGIVRRHHINESTNHTKMCP